MNRQQRCDLYRQMKAHKNAQNKAQYYVNYGRKIQKNFVDGNTTYTEIVFNALGIAIPRLYGFGAGQVGKIWSFADELISEYGQDLLSSEDIKSRAKSEIGMCCSYGTVDNNER